MADKICVGVVDIYPIFRAGVVQAIGRAENIVVVAEGASAEDALRIAPTCDVLLLEAAVSGSLNVVKGSVESNPRTKVVFLSAIEDDEHASRALRLGVYGYLNKNVKGTDLINVVTAVHFGQHQIELEIWLGGCWRRAKR